VRPYLRARAALWTRLTEQRDLLARELALLRAAGEQRDELQLATTSLDRQRVHLLGGQDPLAATAALVGVVGDKARIDGVDLQSIESQPVERVGGGLVSVRIELSARGDFEGVLRWLHALESDTRLLQVDWLTVAGSGAADSATPSSSALRQACARLSETVWEARGEPACESCFDQRHQRARMVGGSGLAHR